MNMLKLLNVSSESSKLPKEYRENPQFYTLEVLNSIYKLRKQDILSKLSKIMNKTVLSITDEIRMHLRIAYNIRVVLTQDSRHYLYINKDCISVQGDAYRWEFVKFCLYEMAADFILADPDFSPKPVRRFVYIDNYKLCTVKAFDEAKEGYPFLMSGVYVYIKVSDDTIESLNCKTKESQTYVVAYSKK